MWALVRLAIRLLVLTYKSFSAFSIFLTDMSGQKMAHKCIHCSIESMLLPLDVNKSCNPSKSIVFIMHHVTHE